ncbi:MAG: DUF3575 domain-containing protein [Alistipes sp.]|nr:DUF3575 domain-containing protein [Alistipes sp.]
MNRSNTQFSTYNNASYCLAIVMLALAMFIPTTSVMAQSHKMADDAQVREEMRIHFRASKTYIDKSYMNNDSALQQIVEWAEKRQRDSMVDVVSVAFYGACSPEGSVSFNHYLSSTRLSRLENYVRQRVNIPENIIIRNDNYIAWGELEQMVAESDIENKDDILAILRSENTSTGEQLDSRIHALKAMDNGKTWHLIFNRYYTHLRNAYMVIVTQKSELAERLEELRTPIPLSEPTHCNNITISPASIITPVVATATQSHYMYVKTNLVGLGMAIANLGMEVDLAKHWSFALPVYYSAWDYFKSTVKFRTFAVQPELRYWLSENNRGIFAGAHFGLAYFNFAFDGDYRYQDHRCKTPALGGGLAIGYRRAISKNHRWHIEFLLGGGVYDLHYDVFHNVENVKNGKLKETLKDTYYGIDQAAINISYRFDLNKRRK